MANTWVIVADSNRARIFSAASILAPWTEEKDLISAADKSKDYSDQPGRSFNRQGGHRHAMEKEVTPAKEGLIHFAKSIARVVDDQRSKAGLKELVLVAAPEFLGLLRAELNPASAHLVTRELGKNLAQLTSEEIREYLE